MRLLDYAQLRYQSDLSARPVRWDNARDDVAFALERWTTIDPRVTTGLLRLRIDKVLEKMTSAAADHDPVGAEQSATEMLDLIDRLDALFAAL